MLFIDSQVFNPKLSGGSVKAEGLGDGYAASESSHRQAALDAATQSMMMGYEEFMRDRCKTARCFALARKKRRGS
jgi:hypothetical protein